MKVVCAFCGKKIYKSTGHYNRAIKVGQINFYCSRKCLGQNKVTSIEEKKRVKAEYDKKIAKTPERIAKRKEYWKKDYTANPDKYKKERRRRYPYHLKYLQRPEYKKWKQSYDVKFCAKKYYGVFWECSLLLKELEIWLLNNSPDGMHFQMGITNKTQKRKRLWQKSMKQKQKNLQPQV